MIRFDASLTKGKKDSGFTLFEIMIVLALIGLIASVILPGLRRTTKSDMMDGINHLSSQAKLAYNNAIFTGRVHRMVFDVENGNFWTEMAPRGFSGRAPVVTQETQDREKAKLQLIDKLNDEAKSADATQMPILEIPVKQLQKFQSTAWGAPKSNLIAPQEFTGRLIFVQIATDLTSKVVKYPLQKKILKVKKSDKKAEKSEYLAYVYFFPNGTTTQASFQIGFRDDDGNIDNNALKYTLQLNILTGQMKLILGFQEPDFELSK